MRETVHTSERSREPHPVRAYRLRHGLSLLDVANRAGISESGLSRIELTLTGFPVPSAIAALADACDGEVSEIDIFRYHMAAVVGIVPAMTAPMTEEFCWGWVRRG
jgi:transcriptional regulator with XRE-family HTH domain